MQPSRLLLSTANSWGGCEDFCTTFYFVYKCLHTNLERSRSTHSTVRGAKLQCAAFNPVCPEHWFSSCRQRLKYKAKGPKKKERAGAGYGSVVAVIFWELLSAEPCYFDHRGSLLNLIISISYRRFSYLMVWAVGENKCWTSTQAPINFLVRPNERT